MAIERIKSDMQFLSEANFRVDPTVDYPQVESLNLGGIGLRDDDWEKLMPQLTSLEWLKELDLSNNEFTMVHEDIGGFECLQSLSLENNSLESFLEETHGLKSLEVLQIGQNSLNEFPPGIIYLPGIRRLQVDRNCFQTIPEQIGELRNLEDLVLWGNQIRILPQSVGKLQKLKTLELHYNQLEEFPVELGSLKELRELRADRNLLCEISDEFGDLQNLEKLELWGNLIETVSPELERLQHLKILSLSNNQIAQLPESLFEMEGLEIQLDGNPILGMGDQESLPTKRLQNLDSPIDLILQVANTALSRKLSKFSIPDSEISKPVFSIRQQLIRLERELSIIGKHRDKNPDTFKEKLDSRAELFIRNWEKRAKGILTSKHDIDLADLSIPQNLKMKGNYRLENGKTQNLKNNSRKQNPKL